MNREKHSEKRIPILYAVLIVIAFLVIVGMVLHRQRTDLRTLERVYQEGNAARIQAQNEQSEKQREVNISTTSDYIAEQARKNGYMMKDEIHFVVSNPEVLTNRATLDEAVVAAAEPEAGAPEAPSAGTDVSDPAATSENMAEEATEP